jgi:flagellar FliJ protein
VARFVFRLAPVLRQRERVEETRKQLLAAAQRALADAEKERARLRDRREALARELIADHRKLDGETLRLIYGHLDFLAREIAAADRRVATCAAAVEEARAALLRASKDRKILDRLRERQREVFDLEQMRHEHRELDDANARRYERLMNRGGTP